MFGCALYYGCLDSQDPPVAKPKNRIDAVIAEATALARDVAPDLASILLTQYPDADTLDTLRPGETDLATVTAVNRAVATALWQAGVEIFVQIADRAAFRRFMSGRDDTQANRRAWIDRTRLLHGAAAMKALGVVDAGEPPKQSFGKAPGPIADRLLDAYGDEDSGEFDAFVQALLTAGRIDVLDLAVRKLGERYGDEAADEFNWVLLVAAEGAALGPSGWAELVTLPVALPADSVPDGEALAQGLVESGALPATDDVRLLPGWRSPEALAELSYAAVRRVLVDLVDDRAPRDLPPGDTDELSERGFGVLLGLRIDWAIPVWDTIFDEGGLPEAEDEDEEPTPEEADREARFQHWQSGAFQNGQGCVPLGLVAFSDTAAEIAAFLADAGEQTESFEEIREFIAMAYNEAGGEAVVCRSAVVGDALELSLYTENGRFLDDLSLPASRLPAPAEEVQQIVEGFVQMARGGRSH